MKILLISPHPHKRNLLIPKFTYPSLTLQQIAGITPKEHTVKIVDERYEKLNFDTNVDIIGISCLTYNSIRGYEIADNFRKMGKTVVFGGYHASLLPEEAKQHADSVVIGEAELTWPMLLKDFEKGLIKPFYIADKLVEPENIPPARHDIGVYTLFIEAIQASRGCPTGCEFCAMQKIEGAKFRGRPIKNVIDEMRTIKSRNIFFADASLTINPSFTKSLFKEMIELNKKSECFGNINILSRDDEFLKIASEAGVKKWYVGIESISQENINASGKGTNKVEDYAKAIKKIKDYNMDIVGFFMFGFDNDTKDIFNKTLKAIYDWELDQVSFSIVTPYPGTRLFERLDKENRITSHDWSRYNHQKNVNFKPLNMSQEDLVDGIKKIALDYYSIKNTLNRSVKSNDFNPVKAGLIFADGIMNRLIY